MRYNVSYQEIIDNQQCVEVHNNDILTRVIGSHQIFLIKNGKRFLVRSFYFHV